MGRPLRGVLCCLLAASAAAQDVPLAPTVEELGRIKEEMKGLAAPVRAKRRHQLLTVRFPTWEAAAAREGGAFASSGVRLTARDAADARTVFGDAVDLEPVRLVYTDFDLVGAPQTWGDFIRVPVGVGLGRAALVHELAHVWQFQTGGTDYISDSLLHNVWSFVTTGKRRDVYRYKIVPGKSFFDYTAEQQARLLEDYFAKKAKREDPEYRRLVAEMRTRKANRQAGSAALLEKDAGLPPRDRPIEPLEGWEPSREGAGVPQLEIRFDTPW